MKLERSPKDTKRTKPFAIKVNGQRVMAYAGETVAAAMLASGQDIFGYSHRHHPPRSLFCGIGVCFGCMVTIDNVPFQQACRTLAKPAMAITFDTDAGFFNEDP